MKFVTVFFFLFSIAFGEPNFRQQFYDHFYQGDYNRMETTLKEWNRARPNDVEMLAAYGSFYFNRSKKGFESNPAKLTTREEILLSGDPPENKAAGPNPEARFNRKVLSRAADYWKKAVDLYPWRMDIRFWLARAYQDMDNFEAQYLTLAEALQYADKNKGKLKWDNDENLPGRRTQLVPELMQEFEAYYFARHQAAEDEKAFRLAKLTITFYPKHPDAYNSMAAYYSYREDWEHTVKYLLMASQKDPKDCLILNNIGNILVKLGKKKEARIYYEKVIKMNNDGKNVDHAQRKLQEIKGD